MALHYLEFGLWLIWATMLFSAIGYFTTRKKR